MTRRFRCVGSDNDFSYWTTPSWSRGSDIIHELMLNNRTLIVEKCTCEDSDYRPERRLQDLREMPPVSGCKHKRKLAEIVQGRAEVLNR